MKRLILAVILGFLSVPAICVEADQESALKLYERLRSVRYQRQEPHFQVLHNLVIGFVGGKTVVDSVQVEFRAADLPKLRARAVKRLQRIKKLARAEVALCDSLLAEWK